jgi:predicted nucleic acid-binding protein
MKERIFLDTNVVVDLLGEREPFYNAIAKIATLADKGKIKIIISALTFTTVFYLLSRYEEKKVVKEKIKKLKIIVETSYLTSKEIDKGLLSKFNDFEDAVQYYCALESNCNAIVTRNGKDFKYSEIAIFTPDEYLSSF